MKRRNEPPSLNPVSVAMIIGFALGAIADLRRLGVPEADVRKIWDALFGDLKRQHDDKVREQAFRLWGRWRKADVPRLLKLGLASEAAELKLVKDKLGRGVVPEPKSFEQAFEEALALLMRYADPTTSAEERRELHHRNMPKHPDLIEAAYRGALEEARRKKPRGPHRKVSEIAEEAVAAAAGISVPVVHQLCQQVRDRHAPGEIAEPAMSAAELARHLDCPAELAKKSDFR